MMDQSFLDRFWARVDVREDDECWPWLGQTYNGGRSRISHNGTKYPITHVALESDGRPRIDGLHALHSCDNPPCCNPKHLRWGTNHDNNLEMISKGRHWGQLKTHCSKGHELTGDNLAPSREGLRVCRACQRISWAKREEKRKADRDAGIVRPKANRSEISRVNHRARQEFIASTLRDQGRIRRSDIVEHFGISLPLASRDLVSFMATNPPDVKYDVSIKAYVYAEPRP